MTRGLERQPRVLLGLSTTSSIGEESCTQVFQLVFLGTLIELTGIGETMQKRRQVPGDSDRAPDPASSSAVSL